MSGRESVKALERESTKVRMRHVCAPFKDTARDVVFASWAWPVGLQGYQWKRGLTGSGLVRHERLVRHEGTFTAGRYPNRHRSVGFMVHCRL